MKRLKMVLSASVLSLAVLACPGLTTYAISTSEIIETENREDDWNKEVENNAVGGWTEDTGYYKNIHSYAKAMENVSVPYSTPSHTGKAEQRTYNGTTQKRAHGWTTWIGEYHYTRARMEHGDVVLTDSERQWGYDGTEAISPWWSFDGVTLGSARTYYGK